MTPIRQLIAEIHRRSLWQVLAVYLVGAWVAYEVILALTDGVGLPGWVPGFAIVLFLIGLPVVLATAIVQEGGPSAESTAAALDPPRSSSSSGSGKTVDDAEPDAGSAEPGEAGRADGTSSSFLTWPRAITAGLVAFALLGLATVGFLGMRALGIGPVGTLVAKGQLEAKEPLVVADFRPLTEDTSLAAVVTEGLRADLAQSSFLTTADRARVRATLERMLRDPAARLDAATAREVAQRLGLKAVVEGEVGRAGTGYLLTARVVTTDSVRTLTTVRATATDSTEILTAIEGLSRGLRERVGESLKKVRGSPPLEQVTTSSLPALRKAVEAQAIERRGEDRTRAIQLMNEAVALDPGFAWAWKRLAIMHYNDGDLTEAIQAIDRAVAHQDRLPEKARYDAQGMRAVIVGDLPAGRRAYENFIARDSTEFIPHINVSDIAWNEGDWDAAVRHAERAIELGADEIWVAHWNRVIAMLDSGRLEEAREATAKADSLLPPESQGTVQDLRGMILAAEARYDSLHVLALEWDDPWRAAMQDRVLGRWREMRQHLTALGPEGERNAEAYEAWHRFLVLNEPEAGDSVVAHFHRITAGPDTVSGAHHAQLAAGLAMRGRVDDARNVRAYYRAGVPEAIRWREEYLLRAIDGFIALHEGRGDSAIATLRRARESTPWTAPMDAFLGHAYDVLARADSAIAAYTRYVETPWSLRNRQQFIGDGVFLVPAHLRLASLHEGAGRLDTAARHAAEVVRLWDDADPVLDERVAAMRRIVERAEAGNGRPLLRPPPNGAPPGS